MLFEDFAHDFLSFFVGDLLCLLKEEIGLLLIGNVELIGKSIADFPSEELGRERSEGSRMVAWNQPRVRRRHLSLRTLYLSSSR
jgi:hypothetical protein